MSCFNPLIFAIFVRRPARLSANNRPTSARNNGMPNYAISEFARDVGRSKIMAGRPVIDAMSSKVFPQTMSGS